MYLILPNLVTTVIRSILLYERLKIFLLAILINIYAHKNNSYSSEQTTNTFQQLKTFQIN